MRPREEGERKEEEEYESIGDTSHFEQEERKAEIRFARDIIAGGRDVLVFTYIDPKLPTVTFTTVASTAIRVRTG